MEVVKDLTQSGEGREKESLLPRDFQVLEGKKHHRSWAGPGVSPAAPMGRKECGAAPP